MVLPGAVARHQPRKSIIMLQYTFYTCRHNPAARINATAATVETAIVAMVAMGASAYTVMVEGFDPVEVRRHPNGGWYIRDEHLESGDHTDRNLASVLMEAVDIVDDYIDGYEMQVAEWAADDMWAALDEATKQAYRAKYEAAQNTK